MVKRRQQCIFGTDTVSASLAEHRTLDIKMGDMRASSGFSVSPKTIDLHYFRHDMGQKKCFWWLFSHIFARSIWLMYVQAFTFGFNKLFDAIKMMTAEICPWLVGQVYGEGTYYCSGTHQDSKWHQKHKMADFYPTYFDFILVQWKEVGTCWQYLDMLR